MIDRVAQQSETTFLDPLSRDKLSTLALTSYTCSSWPAVAMDDHQVTAPGEVPEEAATEAATVRATYVDTGRSGATLLTPGGAEEEDQRDDPLNMTRRMSGEILIKGLIMIWPL